jgi:hypothetical protein
MSNRNIRRGTVCSCLVALVAIVALQPGLGAADEPDAKKGAAQRRTTNKPVVGAPRNPRMPAHFNKVINESQRTKILTILKDYTPRIAQKRAELKALVDQRDKAAFGILTADQKRQVEELRAASQAKRKANLAASRETKPEAASPKSKARKPAAGEK